MARKNQSGGGNEGITARVAALEEAVQGQSTALEGKLGIDKATQSAAVTGPGWVADARELNAGLPGTLSNKVQAAVESLGAIGEVVQGKKFKAYIEADKEGVIGEITLPPGLWYIACSGWTPLGSQAAIYLGRGSWHGTQCAMNRYFNFSAVLYNGQQITRELAAWNCTTENLESAKNYEFYAVRLK